MFLLIIYNCIAHVVFTICVEEKEGLLNRKIILYKTITSNSTIQPKIRTVKRLLQGCHGQGKIIENYILFRVRETSGSLYQVREFLNPCSKSGKFILWLAQIISLDVFV